MQLAEDLVVFHPLSKRSARLNNCALSVSRWEMLHPSSETHLNTHNVV